MGLGINILSFGSVWWPTRRVKIDFFVKKTSNLGVKNEKKSKNMRGKADAQKEVFLIKAEIVGNYWRGLNYGECVSVSEVPNARDLSVKYDLLL